MTRPECPDETDLYIESEILELRTAYLELMEDYADHLEIRMLIETTALRSECDRLMDADRCLVIECAKLVEERDKLRGLLQESLRCLKAAKVEWAPSTTNSDADVLIARIDAALQEDTERLQMLEEARATVGWRRRSRLGQRHYTGTRVAIRRRRSASRGAV